MILTLKKRDGEPEEEVSIFGTTGDDDPLRKAVNGDEAEFLKFFSAVTWVD